MITVMLACWHWASLLVGALALVRIGELPAAALAHPRRGRAWWIVLAAAGMGSLFPVGPVWVLWRVGRLKATPPPTPGVPSLPWAVGDPADGGLR